MNLIDFDSEECLYGICKEFVLDANMKNCSLFSWCFNFLIAVTENFYYASE